MNATLSINVQKEFKWPTFCSFTGKVDIYEQNRHNSEHFIQLNHGMTDKAKETVEYLIHNNDARAKRIAVKILLKIYRKLYKILLFIIFTKIRLNRKKYLKNLM